MKRFIIDASIAVILGLGIGLALVWAWGGGGAPAVAASRAEETTDAPSAPADELHVCLSGCAYSSVQAAVDAASDGDVIKVATGVYTDVSARPAPAGYQGAPASGLITQVVYISKTVTIRGGYTSAFTEPPNPEANPTTLDAQGQGRVLLIAGVISPTAEGLRITGGNATGLGSVQASWTNEALDAGGGVYVITATPTISNNYVFNNTAIGDWTFGGGLCLVSSGATVSRNTFSANTATTAGGGLFLYYSNATLSGNTISANTAGQSGGLQLVYSPATVSGNTFSANTATTEVGGGLGLYASDATVNRNTITGNTAAQAGGGLHLEISAATVSGNTITGNTAEQLGGGGLQMYHSADTIIKNTISGNTAYWGGGVHLNGGNATLINNVIADNRATYVGSGLRIYDSSPNLLHNTIARNTGGDGSGVYVASNSDVELVNTVLAGHRVGIYVASGSTADLEGTLWGSGSWANTTDRSGPGTINHSDDHTGDPAFVDPDNGDYHIAPASAAIDAGVDAGVDDDMDGELRTDGHPDIGADEFPHNPGLTISKRANPDPVQPGQQLTYTISVANTGNKYLHATITDTLPLSVTLGGTLIPPGGTLTPPGGTVVLPDGRVAVVWTAVITAPGGTWVGTIHVTADEDAEGPLTNLVEVTTKEGAMGQARAIVNAHKVYLPLVMRSFQ